MPGKLHLPKLGYGLLRMFRLVRIRSHDTRTHRCTWLPRALGGGSEITKPQKNKYYESAKQKLLLASNKEGHKFSKNRIVQEAMNQTILNAESRNQTVVFKVNPHNMGLILDEQHGLRLMNVKFVQFYRSNYLDHALCEVRDCMVRGKPLGYPVFATNGTRTDLCFFRRKKINKHIKVLYKHTLQILQCWSTT